MKRDIDLVRDILFSVEADEDKVSTDTEADEDMINYHLHLTIQAGLVNGQEINEGQWSVLGLSWEGYELLELIRDHDRWGTIRRRLDILNCYSFRIIKKIAIYEMKV
jgi:hypothetical protein